MLKNTLNIDEMETALGFLGCTSPQDLTRVSSMQDLD
jgi:hypothetical protein